MATRQLGFKDRVTAEEEAHRLAGMQHANQCERRLPSQKREDDIALVRRRKRLGLTTAEFIRAHPSLAGQVSGAIRRLRANNY